MRRRLGPTEFERAIRLMKSPEETGLWSVCDEYELRGDEIVAKWAREERSHWRMYAPLEETPDLCLRLAALYEEPDFSEAVLAFSHKYGMPSGPDKMKLSDSHLEVEGLWIILKYYEMTLNRDEDTAKAVAKVIERDFGMADSDSDDSPTREPSPLLPLIHAVYEVNKVVRERCCQFPYFTESIFSPEHAVSGIRGVWTFDDLFAAAYLQMWWLMISGGDLTRCGHCRRPMSLAQPHPSGRKRRRDKRFCSDSCRQAYHRSKRRGEP